MLLSLYIALLIPNITLVSLNIIRTSRTMLRLACLRLAFNDGNGDTIQLRSL